MMKAGNKYAPYLLATCFLAGACGKVGDLEPQSANGGPPKAYGQVEEQTARKLVTPSAQARPGRSDELLRRSTKRTADPFDLPPGYSAAENEETETEPVLVEESEIP